MVGRDSLRIIILASAKRHLASKVGVSNDIFEYKNLALGSEAFHRGRVI